MRTLEITSLQNSKIKQLVRLKERRERERSQLFLIEGYRELSRAITANAQIESLFFCPELFLGENENSLIQTIANKNSSIFILPKSLFEKVSYRDRPDGLIAIAHQKHLNLDDIKLSKNPFLVVAEAIEKPGNLGTILRTCDGVGADGLILCDRCTDLHNPNTVRASVGTLFTVPVYEATSIDTIAFLKKQRISVVATTPDAASCYTETDLSGPIALILGTEQLGLSEQWIESADKRISIPMKGVADSLNVAVATALTLYEALRQRGS
ncbi:MAG: RNA methyltransferase [Parachlamydiales bacterium]|nr:RNA methyltransferase [Parachlamydiales bacterium]